MTGRCLTGARIYWLRGLKYLTGIMPSDKVLGQLLRCPFLWGITLKFTATQKIIRDECNAIRDMLLEKNRRYGNSALEPVRIFSRADTDEQIKVRLDDKLSRLARGDPADEDVVLDLIGYLVLLRVARKLRKGKHGK